MDKVYQVNYNGQNLLLTQEGVNLLFSGQKVELTNSGQVFQVGTAVTQTRQVAAVPRTVIVEKCDSTVQTEVAVHCAQLPSVTTSISQVGCQLVHAVMPPAMPHVVPEDLSQPHHSQTLNSVNGRTSAIVSNETNTNGDYLHGNIVTTGNITTSVITVPPALDSASRVEDILHLVVTSPDGVERTVTLDQPPTEKAISLLLTEVCRQFGIDDAMEAIVPDIWTNDRSDEVSTSPVKIIYPSENEVDEKSEKSSSKSDHEDIPLYISGKLALCDYCGFLSLDFSRCQRCTRKFNKNVKIVADPARESLVKQHGLYNYHDVKRRYLKKHKKMEETETVTILSSDEEESEDKSEKLSEELRRTVRDKEPVITEQTESPDQLFPSSLAGGGKDLNELIDSPDVENVQLECRTVRIGSYKVVPNEHVILSSYGLRIKVDSLKGDATTIKILRNEIVKVLVHFGSELPVMFYYITAPAGRKVRTALNMSAKEGNIYFDPTSSEEIYKRITLLPDQICEESRLFIKSIYENNGLLGELDSNEANDILVRAANNKKDGNQTTKKPLTQSTNNSPSCKLIQTIMIYPPPPMKGGISINTEDYACLGGDQFLNDVIIDFYLKYLVQNILSEEDRKRTHVLSSFFYKRLTSKTSPTGLKANEDPNMSSAEKRHTRVKGWTKGVNIFAKDFIIIPINESSHWFLAIICFPGLQSVVRMSDNQSIDDTGRRSNISRKSSNRGGGIPSTIGETTITVVSQPSGVSQTITVESEGEERDEADGNDEDLEPNSSDDESKEGGDNNGDLMDEEFPKPQKAQSGKNYPLQEPIKQACILVFDSLMGVSRSKVIATLREYLHVEYKIKHKGATRDFTKNYVKGAVPKVPQQNNFTDCGLYVLQYVEEFFRNPLTDFRMPLKLQDWFDPEIVSRKRYEIQQLLHKLMDDQGVDRERINLPRLDLRPDGGRYSEEEEDEGMEEGVDEELEEEEMGEEEEEEEPLDEEMDDDDAMMQQVTLPPPPPPAPVVRSAPQPPSPVIRTPRPRLSSPIVPNQFQARHKPPQSTASPTTTSAPRLAVRPSVVLEPRSAVSPQKRTLLPSPDVVTIKKKPVTPTPTQLKEIRSPRVSHPSKSPLPRISSSVEITKKKMRND